MAETREFAASIGQRLLWLMDRYRGSAGALNEPMTWRLRGPLDIGALSAAVDALIERHESLRTAFLMRDNQLLQVIKPPVSAGLAPETVCSGAGEQEVLAALEAETGSRIDIGEGPLRIRLWRLSPTDHILCLNIHHLAMDRRSATVIADELAMLYSGAELPPSGWQYAAWAEWQRDRMSGARLAELRHAWTDRLQDVQVPALRQVSEAAPGAGPEPDCVLGERQVSGLQRLAADVSAGLFAVTLAMFFALIWARTGVREPAVASVFDGRDRPEVADTVGFFEHLVLLRASVRADQPMTDLIADAQAEIDFAAANGLPLHLLPPAAARLGGPDGARRIDDVVFSHIVCLDEPVEFSGLRLDHVPVSLERTEERFGLRVLFAEYPGQLVGMFHCAPKVMPSWAAGFGGVFSRLADELVERPSATVGRTTLGAGLRRV